MAKPAAETVILQLLIALSVVTSGCTRTVSHTESESSSLTIPNVPGPSEANGYFLTRSVNYRDGLPSATTVYDLQEDRNEIHYRFDLHRTPEGWKSTGRGVYEFDGATLKAQSFTGENKRENYRRDSAGRLVAINYQKNGVDTKLDQFVYDRDRIIRIDTSLHSSKRSWSRYYFYDAAGLLSGTDYKSASRRGDRRNCKTTVTQVGARKKFLYTEDCENRLVTLQIDSNGNVVEEVFQLKKSRPGNKGMVERTIYEYAEIDRTVPNLRLFRLLASRMRTLALRHPD